MLEKCQNCGGRVVKGIKNQRGVFCSAECLNNAIHPGFCAACMDATTEKSSGGTFTFNGIGTKLYGAREQCKTCGSVIQKHWVTFLWIPVFPLGRYRIKHTAPTRFLSRKMK